MQVDRVALRADIDHAFDAGPLRAANIADLLATPYGTNEDAYELAEVLFSRAWAEVPVRELFRHRGMLFALSPEAFRAYLPAYLAACLLADSSFDEYGADLRHFLLETLIADPNASPSRRATTDARLTVLNGPQRAATAAVVHYLKDRWNMSRADDALHYLATH